MRGVRKKCEASRPTFHFVNVRAMISDDAVGRLLHVCSDGKLCGAR
jgi:hypothetical protein